MLCDCGHQSDINETKYSPGYGKNAEGKTHCYACCGTMDRLDIEAGKPTAMYVTDNFPSAPKDKNGVNWSTGRVGNWSGSFSLPCTIRYKYKWGRLLSTHVEFRHEGKLYYGNLRSVINQCFTARMYK